MSIATKFMAAVLAVGATIAAPADAFASTAPPAVTRPSTTAQSTLHSVSTALDRIRKVACRSYTFNVYYHNTREICYQGIGTIRPSITDVYRITAGSNAGVLCVHVGSLHQCTRFTRNEPFNYPRQRHVALDYVRIITTSHP
jgi:hypothetical protein